MSKNKLSCIVAQSNGKLLKSNSVNSNRIKAQIKLKKYKQQRKTTVRRVCDIVIVIVEQIKPSTSLN